MELRVPLISLRKIQDSGHTKWPKIQPFLASSISIKFTQGKFYVWILKFKPSGKTHQSKTKKGRKKSEILVQSKTFYKFKSCIQFRHTFVAGKILFFEQEHAFIEHSIRWGCFMTYNNKQLRSWFKNHIVTIVNYSEEEANQSVSLS